MYLFIVIILIAELVIALQIISFILGFDRKVILLDAKITELRPSVQEISVKIKNTSSQLLEAVKNICNIVKARREKIFTKIIQEILIYLLIFLFKSKKKKFVSLMHLVCALKDYWACN